MIAQQIINGLALGLIYALLAVGYSLVFGILRLVNFSHGSVYAFGAHICLMFFGMELGIIPGIILSIIFTGMLGISIDLIALKPLRVKKSIPIAALITTIGISYIIQNGLMLVYGSERKSFPKLLSFESIEIGNVIIGSSQLLILSVSIILLVALTLLINKTKIGLAMRAIEQNPKAAKLMGINVDFIVSFTFFLGGVSAVIGGVLISSYYQIIYPTMGFMAGLKAFSAAVLGGIGVLYGSVIGGLIVGISENIAVVTLGGTYRDAVAFIILIVVLIFKPVGIFGKKAIKKV